MSYPANIEHLRSEAHALNGEFDVEMFNFIRVKVPQGG
jgi:hypothetical protein